MTHRRSTRTTNLLERLFVEERRRLKIIPNGFGEKPVLKLMFGALVRRRKQERAWVPRGLGARGLLRRRGRGGGRAGISGGRAENALLIPSRLSSAPSNRRTRT